MSDTIDSANQTKNIPKLPDFPDIEDPKNDDDKVAVLDTLIDYIGEVGEYLLEVREYIESNATTTPLGDSKDVVEGGGKKKQSKTKKKGGADIDYSKVYNVQGLIENISKSTGKDPITSQSIPAPFSTGSALQRLGKKEAKSLPNELKNEIIPDYSQDGGKKKKTEKKKMPKKK